MISCPSDERLAQLLEEQLDRRELVDIERHLERCGHCQETLEGLTRERFSFDNWKTSSDPDSDPDPDPMETASSTESTLRQHSRTIDSPARFSATVLHTSVDVLPEVEGYEILERIGQGGMGVVYRARQGGLERLVALKVIRGGIHAAPEHLARFRIEARAVARLGHPNVVQIHDVGRSAGVPFVAFELLEGGSLEGRVAGTPQPERSSAELLVTLARAMGVAHRAGVVHRDLKSANVLYAADGTPKIADFGLAKRLDEDDGQTQTGQVMGSPSFMAPEQAQGGEVGTLADVYSLGAIFYEMLTGRPPFKGSSAMETLFQVVHDEPVSPLKLRPGLSRDLETIALKCLAKVPNRRYESADALADDLDRYLSGSPILARPIGLRERAWKWARRQPVVASLVLIALVAAIASGSVAYRSQQNLKYRERAEIQSAARLEKDGVAAIAAGQLALRDHDYKTGLKQLAAFQSRIAANSRLGDLRTRVNDLVALLEKSEDDQARNEATRIQLARFRTLRRRAQLLDAQLVGIGEFRDIQGLRQVIRDALANFGGTDPTIDPETVKLPQLLTEPEQAEIQKGRYELLLILAEATARPMAGEAPHQQAEAGLAILARAKNQAPSKDADQAFHLIKADCLARKGDPSAADDARQSASTHPADAFGHLLEGEAFHRRQKWPEAIREFETALRLEPDLFRAQLLLAVSQLQSQKYNQARTNLTACIQREPQAITLHLLRGFASGEEAVDRQKFAQKAGTRREEFLKESEILFEAAESDFEVVRSLHPTPEETYCLRVNRGALRLRRHRLDDAVGDLIAATALRPDEVSAYIVLGQTYRQQGRIDAAIAQFTRGIALKPEMAALYRNRALTRLDRARPSPEARDEALRDLSEAIRFDPPGDPEFVRDRARRARLLLQAGRPGDALIDCQDALRANPANPDALVIRVRALLDLKRFDDVLEACDEALAQKQASGELYELRGLARASRSDYTGAIHDYNQSLALDPNRSTPLIQRGWAYLVSEAPSMAFSDFNEAIQIAPDEPDAYNGRGFARVFQGKYKEAVADAEAALLRGVNDSRTHYNAARIYAKAANAVNTANPRRTQRPIAEAYQDRAQTLIRLALERMPPNERGEFWRSVIEADPALTALRQRPKFSQLAGQYGRLAK